MPKTTSQSDLCLKAKHLQVRKATDRLSLILKVLPTPRNQVRNVMVATPSIREENLAFLKSEPMT